MKNIRKSLGSSSTCLPKLENKLMNIHVNAKSYSSKPIRVPTGAGFSLIELLVGVAIIITTSTIVLSIIISSFRISSKTTETAIVRQNGNYTLSQISRMLQFADSFVGVRVNESDPESSISPCLVNGASYEVIDIVYNKDPKTIICSNNGITINGESSIDSGKVKVVSGSCEFICSQQDSEGPVVQINFDLTTDDGNTSIEESATVNFTTRVKIRNL